LVPHAPHRVAVFVRFVSQPSFVPEQSANPLAHVYVQVPALHIPTVTLTSSVQLLVQDPQRIGFVLVAVSQPSFTPPQSPNPL
jgi:hypothetical protein